MIYNVLFSYTYADKTEYIEKSIMFSQSYKEAVIIANNYAKQNNLKVEKVELA